MQESTEIKALLHLIDDPDDEVYDTVSTRIVSFGKAIIPNLEHLWETSVDQKLQERIEQLIHRLYFTDLCDEFRDWKKRGGDLLSGSLLVAKYHYPNIQSTTVLQEIEKLRRNIWLELNNYLTPMERVHVLNSIFYNYYKQIGVELNYEQPDPFLINKTLENKSGNVLSNGIIYLILCHLLDIPVQSVAIPRQFYWPILMNNMIYRTLPFILHRKYYFSLIHWADKYIHKKTLSTISKEFRCLLLPPITDL